MNNAICKLVSTLERNCDTPEQLQHNVKVHILRSLHMLVIKVYVTTRYREQPEAIRMNKKGRRNKTYKKLIIHIKSTIALFKTNI